MAETTSIDSKGQLSLSETIRAAAHVEAGAQLVVEVTSDGNILLRPVRDPDQAWFWTEEWQAGEREADEEIAAGRGTFYENGEAFLEALRELRRGQGDADV
jgi:bifunctional DNA-binding transcriptional regulator/antitoxin component of YhaV-PrlF toxin-antitoxin module